MARSDFRRRHARVTNPPQAATLETVICGQRDSIARAANEPRRRPKDSADRLMRPQAAGMWRYFVAEEITPICADFLVERRGFEPMAIAGAGRSRRACTATLGERATLLSV